VKSITYEHYLDKILGCWIGKCIGGTIGAQVEGTKELMNFTLQTAFPDEIPPNDDLDLQVLWLETLHEKGVHTTSCDLADAWMARCWYPFNEYGNFKRNYAKGIRPPTSGAFDNAFFETGMGCPIRAEIWGLICPANPELAAQFAFRDGCLDHTEQSIGAEKLWAAVVAEAFFDADVVRLVRRFIGYLPEGTPVRGCADDVFESFERGMAWQEARMRMLIRHGHPEACDSPVNTGLTILALLYGGGDFGETQLIALNAGYDTDCTCATAGAVMGAAIGARAIPDEWKDPIGDEFVTAIDLRRTDMSLAKLAEDTAAAGLAVASSLNPNVAISDVPAGIRAIAPSTKKEPRIALDCDYNGMPSIAWGETKRITIAVTNETGESFRGELRAECPAPLAVEPAARELELEAGASAGVELAVTVPKTAGQIAQANPISVRLVNESGTTVAEETFGLSGAAPWHCMGVFFDTYDTTVHDSCPWFVDGRYRNPGDQRAWQHHFVNPEKQYIHEGDFDYSGRAARMKELLGPDALIMAHEMSIPVDESVGLKMEMCAYLLLNLISPEQREVNLVIGNTDALRVWVNGESVGADDACRAWSPRNVVLRCSLLRGMNRIVLKVVRRTDNLRISFGVRNFHQSNEANHVDWYTDFSYAVEPVFLE